MLGRSLGQLHVHLILHRNLPPAFRVSESQDDGGRHHVTKPGTASVVKSGDWSLKYHQFEVK